MKNTNNILVAVDGTDSNDYMMERAIEEAQLADATLVVAHVLPRARVEDRQRAIAASPNLHRDGFTYTADQARAEAIAARAAYAAVGDRDVTYATVGAVGTLGPTLLEIADDHDCGTIMLAEECSWWRRRLGWGDRMLARAFEGRVLQAPRRAPGLVDLDPAVIDA